MDKLRIHIKQLSGLELMLPIDEKDNKSAKAILNVIVEYAGDGEIEYAEVECWEDGSWCLWKDEDGWTFQDLILEFGIDETIDNIVNS